MAIYTLVDEDTNTWECSDCREWWSLNSGSPTNNHMKYCPFCGSNITECKDETFEELLDEME